MNDYICEHLEDLHHKYLKSNKDRSKIELEILHNERLLLTSNNKTYENDKRQVPGLHRKS